MKTDRELLEEIKENNRRERLSCEINIRVGERSKAGATDTVMSQIETFIKTQQGRIKDLAMGIEAIDDTINEMSAE